MGNWLWIYKIFLLCADNDYEDIDDNIQFVNLDGTRNRFIPDGGDFHFKNDNYEKINLLLNHNVYAKWDMYDINGLKYEYHQKNRIIYNATDTRLYRWDLTRIVDVTGENEISINYESENPTGWGDKTYIHEITNNTSYKIHFERETRTDKPGTGAYKIYGRERLKHIEIRDIDDNPLYKFDFTYSYSGITATTKKLLLTSIQKIDYHNSDNTMPAYKFVYNGTDTDKSTADGFLNEIESISGGTKTFGYVRDDNAGVDKKYRINTITSNDGMTNSYIKSYTYPEETITNLDFYAYQSNKITLPGTTGTVKYNFQKNGIKVGTVNSVIFKNSSGETVKQVDNTWAIHKTLDLDNDVNDCIHLRLTDENITIDGITREIDYDYNNDNGLVKQITKYGNDFNRVTHIKYAFEKYAEMQSIHMLSQVYSAEITSGATDYSKRWTKWQKFNNTFWAPWEKWVWKGSDSNDKTAPLDPTSESEKIATHESYDIYGNIKEIKNADDVYATTKWGYDNILPIGTIQNTTDNRSLVDGFGEYSSSSDALFLSRWSEKYGHTLSNYASITGKKEVKFDYYSTSSTDNWRGLKRNLSTPMTDLIFECDVIPSTMSNIFYVSTKNNSGYLSLLRFYSNGYIYAYSNGSFGQAIMQYEKNKKYHIKMEVHTLTDQWYLYINGKKYGPYGCTVSGGVTYICYFDYKTAGYATIDNVRLYPADAICSSTAYDPVKFYVTDKTNADGISSYFNYDVFSRLTETYNDDKQIISENSYYYSRDGQSGNFSSTDPNFTSSILFTDEDGYNDFSSSSGWTVSGRDITFDVQNANETTVRMGTSGGWSSIYKFAGSGNQMARVDFYPNNSTGRTPHVLAFNSNGPTYRFCVQYLPSSDQFKIQMIINGVPDYPHTFNLDGSPNQWYTVEIEKREDGNCSAWVFLKGEGRDYNDMYTTTEILYPPNWRPNVRSWSNDDYFYLANHYVGSFQQSTTYTDGLGRVIQNRANYGKNDLVSFSKYDGAGRVHKRYKTYEDLWATTTGFNPVSSAESEANYYYDGNPGPSSGTYPFTEVAYSADPLGRPLKKGKPGSAYSIGGSTNEVEISYGTNDMHISKYDPSISGESYYGDDELFEAEVLDENNNINSVYKDKLGNTVATKVDPDGMDLTTIYQYNPMGKVVRISPPEAREDDVYNRIVYVDEVIDNPISYIERTVTHDNMKSFKVKVNIYRPAECGVEMFRYKIYYKKPSEQTYIPYGNVITNTYSAGQNSGNNYYTTEIDPFDHYSESTIDQLDIKVEWTYHWVSGGDDGHIEFNKILYSFYSTIPEDNFDFDTIIDYDQRGKVISQTNPDAGKVKYRYDKYGNLRFSQDKNQISPSYENEECRVVTEGRKGEKDFCDFQVNFEQTVSWECTITYGGFGVFKIGTTEEGSEIKGVSHSGSGSFTASPNNTYYVTAYTTKELGAVVGTVDYLLASSLNFTEYRYDDFHRLVEVGIAEAGTTGFGGNYPPVNTNYYGTNDWKTKFYYDTDYMNNGENYSKGKLTKTETKDGNHTLYRYDKYGRVLEKKITINGLSAKTLKYEYDHLGKLTKMIYPDNSGVEYTYDKLGRLDKVKNGSVVYAEYSYDVTGNVKSAGMNADDIKGTFNYTINDWISSMNYKTWELLPDDDEEDDYKIFDITINDRSSSMNYEAPEPISGLWGYISYEKFNLINGFDNAGNITSQDYTTLEYSHETDYTYDDAYRLTNFNVDGTSFDRTYSYDRNGNRQSRNTDNYVYGWEQSATTGLNQLKTAHGETYTYDANGNISTFDGNTFVYDYRNLCTGVSGSAARTYKYDAAGRRVKETDGSTHYYIYDGNALIAEYTGSTLTAKCIYGNGRILKIDGSGNKWYFMNDHLGSRRVLYSSQGEIGDDYYPFGEVMQHQGTENGYNKFTGKKRDDALGMDHFFARDYLPQTGRFNGSDPVMEYSNPYSYVANRPLNFVDPLGMQQDNESKIGGRNPRDDPHWDDNQFLTRSRKNYQDNWEQVWAPSISMPPGYASSGGSTAGYLRNHPGGGAAEKGGYWRKRQSAVSIGHDPIRDKEWEVWWEWVSPTTNSFGAASASAQLWMSDLAKGFNINSNTFTRFRSIYKNLDFGRRTFGKLGIAGSSINVGFNYHAMQNGNLSPERFAYRTTGTLISILGGAYIGGQVGGPWGALGGIGISTMFILGESAYDGVSKMWNNMNDVTNRFYIDFINQPWSMYEY